MVLACINVTTVNDYKWPLIAVLHTRTHVNQVETLALPCIVLVCIGDLNSAS